MALPVTIPNEFANATASIPLSQLDTNFNTLANAVNGISDGSETLANVSATTITVTNDATINGLTVGEGAGSVSTNTAVGASALAANTTGANNVAVGYQALDANTTGVENTAVGQSALGANTVGIHNTAVGSNSLRLNTSGAYNTAMGLASLEANTTGSNNTAFGWLALNDNTTGANNTAVGYGALDANTTGVENTAVGSFAGTNITTATEVTAIGYAAMSSSGTAATGSTAIGRAALNNVTGTLNTAIGNGSGIAITSGSKNTILGSYNGNQGGLDIRTANNYIVLSDGDGNPRCFMNQNGSFYSPRIYVDVGGASANVVVASDGQLYRSTSSLRYKNTIQDTIHGLAEVMQLRPVTYKSNNDGSTVFGGLIAEEVHEAGLTEFVAYNKDGEPDALHYGNMVSLAFKAIQELSAQVTALQAEVNTLKGN